MRRFFGKLCVQVLIGVFAGAALGFFVPDTGSAKPILAEPRGAQVAA